MSADGKIAGCERKQIRISSDEDIARAKDLRKKYDAVLVGVGTVIADDPHLTVKGASFYENPIRIVADPHGRTPKNALVVDGRAPTIILTDDGCTEKWDNADALRCGSPFDLDRALKMLSESDIENILVEGGGETISHFFRNGFVDRYTVFVGSMIIGGRSAPTPADGDGWVCASGIPMKMKSVETLGNGVLITYDVK
jgi:2,5-diamino-6-(ribosylamino)-4(3H)-pyrimidinone 5'-phosphate reductase